MPLIPLIIVAAQAAAVTPQEADLRCIAVITSVIGTVAEVERAPIIPLATYYIGRVTGRDPTVDLEAELVRLTSDKAAFASWAPVEQKRCSAEMVKVGADLQRLGSALERKAATTK